MSKGNPIGHCKTCGSEIVETVNDSQFGDGECNGCEYERYKSQPALLEAGFLAHGALCDLSYHWCFRGKTRRFREANEVIDKRAITLNAYGKES